MRIIAGKWRGVRLLAPPGAQTRPILDHVKEAVFNILGAKLATPGRIPSCRVLDLFAGTGSLGLEALSRGASFCTFVEKNRPTAAKLQENLAKVRAGEQAEIRVADILKMSFQDALAGDPYELVFVDPPYDFARRFGPSDPVTRIMNRLFTCSTLHEHATIVLRHPKQARCDKRTFEAYWLRDQRSYGDMTISFLAPGSAEQTY